MSDSNLGEADLKAFCEGLNITRPLDGGVCVKDENSLLDGAVGRVIRRKVSTAGKGLWAYGVDLPSERAKEFLPHDKLQLEEEVQLVKQVKVIGLQKATHMKTS